MQNSIQQILASSQMPQALIEINGEPFISEGDIAQMLEFRSSRELRRLYQRNKGEFLESDVFCDTEGLCVSLTHKPKTGRPAEALYFSQQGAMLLSMLARTPRAREARLIIRQAFQRWQQTHHKPAPMPAPQPDYHEAYIAGYRKGMQDGIQLQVDISRQTEATPLFGSATPQTRTQTASRPTFGRGKGSPFERQYDYEGEVQRSGFSGWLPVMELANIVGCSRDAIYGYMNSKTWPRHWGTRKENGKWLIYIP
jgi:hypothetical protein